MITSHNPYLEKKCQVSKINEVLSIIKHAKFNRVQYFQKKGRQEDKAGEKKDKKKKEKEKEKEKRKRQRIL